jgi:fucose permease
MPEPATMRSASSLKLAIGASFVLIGVVSVLLGQILPLLSSRFGLNDADAGLFFFAQFSGSLIGTLASGRLARSIGFRGVMVLGFGAIALGLPLLNAESYSICWIAIFLYGMGTGFSIPAGNLLTIEITARDRRTAAVNLVNFCWGAGAIICPPLVATLAYDGSLIALSGSLVSPILLLSVVVMMMPHAVATGSDTIRVGGSDIWRRPSSWLFAMFSVVIIGIEAGLSGWLTTYSNLLRTEGGLSINAAFVYFASFVGGRAIASLIAQKISDNVLISINAVLLIAGIALLAIGSRESTVPGAVLAGLGTSAIFPTHMVRFARIFGPGATRNATPIFVSGIIGAALISWFIGFVSTRSGSLRNGIALLMAAAVVLAVLQALISSIFSRAFRFDTTSIKR